LKTKEILIRAVKKISEEYKIPEEEVWKAALKIKEKIKV